MAPPKIDILTRLERNSYKQADCKIWLGKKNREGGYGYIKFEGKHVLIGRLICFLYHGADLNDKTWTANHVNECTSSLCWNPEHLYVGTQLQNVRDSIDKGTFNITGLENWWVRGTK